jgi:flagellar basal body-associated protein FliL
MYNDNDLGPAKGICVAIIISLVLWVIVIAGVTFLTHSHPHKDLQQQENTLGHP